MCFLKSFHSRSLLYSALLGALVVAGVGCSASGEIQELRQENEHLREALSNAREEASSPQRGETIQVLSTDIYFKSGSADLTSQGVEELKPVARRIREDYPDRIIRVEGYTDDRPIGKQLTSKYPSNWELSAARAARVARHFRWTHNVEAERLEIVGFGAQHPVAPNETAEGRRKNRRVRVAVLPSAPVDGAEAEMDVTSRP